MEHVWVKHMIAKVFIVSSPTAEEGFIAMMEQAELARAEEEGVYGCDVCSVPLNHATVNTSCQGADPGLDTR